MTLISHSSFHVLLLLPDRPGAPGVCAEDQAPDPGLTFSTLESKLVKRVTDTPVNPSCVVLLPNDTTGVQIDYLFVALDGRAKIESVDLIDDGVRWYVTVGNQYLDTLLMCIVLY